MEDVFVAAARLQELVPDAVLVGGSAAAHHAGHRISLDDGHIVQNLRDLSISPPLATDLATGRRSA